MKELKKMNLINIQVQSENNSFEKKELLKIHALVSDIVRESKLLESAINCSGIRVIVNPKIEDYTELRQISHRLFWAFNAADMQISNAAWTSFCLRVVHIDLDKSIDRLLFVFMEENAYNQTTNSQPKTDNGVNNEDDENVKSYMAISPKYKLGKVIMSAETKRQINRAIALIRNQKRIYQDWGFSEIDPHTKTILCFYGSPGTGKTMCAHALASELGKKILIASYASIESKWVGEGPKNLQRIFKDAEEQDAILFFDEADSFLSKRVNNAETGSDKHYNRMSNEMFQLLEDYNGIIVFATNLVTDFDKAFKSRILAFVEFEKPDLDARKRLIQIMIPSGLPMIEPLSEDNLEELSLLSDGFSGREIRKAMLTTLSEGAMNGVTSFSMIEFLKGFSSVKEETEAIESSMNDGVMRNCIEDFYKENQENQYILDVCLKTIWQYDDITNEVKEQLYKICRILNLDMPDLTISYKNKNISDAVVCIREADRINECAKYCAELVTKTKVGDRKSDQFDSILMELGISDIEKFHNYVSIINQMV